MGVYIFQIAVILNDANWTIPYINLLDISVVVCMCVCVCHETFAKVNGKWQIYVIVFLFSRKIKYPHFLNGDRQ